ncbi:hypothetical protein [Hyunsoonleella rubra]|uniref:Uncharacterized protein n=1 Tax=Hyunsoonleella rubra TaxID=1737062 RepID=A0ABW5T5V3_9FLAO
MAFFVGLVLFFVLVLALLFAPITICINTNTNQYYVKFKGLAQAYLEPNKEELFRIRLKILMFNFYFNPLKAKKTTYKKKRDDFKPKKKFPFRKVLRIIKTFRVTYFLLDIDTDNCVLNAKLYPLFALLNYKRGYWHINFQGRNQLVLVVKNRPMHIIKSFINF